MSADERKELWSELCIVEDWLRSGMRLPRTAPDFTATDSAADYAGLADIAAKVATCGACALAQTRGRTVFGEGCESPLALVIGEAPGAEEDATGRPFVGASGRLLDKMLGSIGLSRDSNAYIANVVKCRPPQNRDPAADEMALCLGYLCAQIDMLKPRAILCLGRVAAQAMLHSKEPLARLRGRWVSCDGIPLLVSYHPSALLRDESLKRPAWEDLKLFKAFLDEKNG